MSVHVHRPVVLIVRDGWGTSPHPEWNDGNALFHARTPVDDHLTYTYPHALIRTSGVDVGLPAGVMGNSEVGHQNIGAGRVVEQEVMRISGRIADGSFYENPALRKALDFAHRRGGRLHLLGLCSDGRVHSDLEHLYGLIELTTRQRFPGNRVFVHAITDGRDTSPRGGLEYLAEIERRLAARGINPIASVVGRFWAMDRDNRWERVEKAYRMLVGDGGAEATSAKDCLEYYYDNPPTQNEYGDEFVTPTITLPKERTDSRIKDGDSVILFNFRGDRPREIVKAFTLSEFPFRGPEGDTRGFERKKKLDLCFVTMTGYEVGLPVDVAFEKPPRMKQILGAYWSELGLTQFRCAETEKYPHVTYFFNDYRDDPFPGETQHMVPSPRHVSTYDQAPEMSAREVTDVVTRALEKNEHDAYIINFANCDMVGHTGVMPAAIKAAETVDECVGKIVKATEAKGGSLIITADHGNCEQMIDPASGGPHTAHTTYDVSLIVVDDRFVGMPLVEGGRLCDIAPTMLALQGLPQPAPMTGISLLPKP